MKPFGMLPATVEPIVHPTLGPVQAEGGAFFLSFRGVKLGIIASCGADWDHVSVSLPNRCPNWPEMCAVKDAFFFPSETVMQLHVPPQDHINNHPYCLHLWRPQSAEIPRPPGFLVGIK